MGSTNASQRTGNRLVRPVVGVLVFLLLFTGLVSVTGAYPELVCGLNQASAGRAKQDHDDTHAITEDDHHSATLDQSVSIDTKLDNSSCGCESCRNYFNGHLNGLISSLPDSAHLQRHLTFTPPPPQFIAVTSIPETPPPKRSHA